MNSISEVSVGSMELSLHRDLLVYLSYCASLTLCTTVNVNGVDSGDI